MDSLTPEQRRRCMAAVHGRDTQPELIVRRFLFSQGFRYRINCAQLPGRPDIVLHKYRTVIFVNGCFWHGHKDCRKAVLPKTNAEFWREKIMQNKARDARNIDELKRMGWNCLVVWQCELEPAKRERTFSTLMNALRNVLIAHTAI